MFSLICPFYRPVTGLFYRPVTELPSHDASKSPGGWPFTQPRLRATGSILALPRDVLRATGSILALPRDVLRATGSVSPFPT